MVTRSTPGVERSKAATRERRGDGHEDTAAQHALHHCEFKWASRLW